MKTKKDNYMGHSKVNLLVSNKDNGEKLHTVNIQDYLLKELLANMQYIDNDSFIDKKELEKNQLKDCRIVLQELIDIEHPCFINVINFKSYNENKETFTSVLSEAIADLNRLYHLASKDELLTESLLNSIYHSINYKTFLNIDDAYDIENLFGLKNTSSATSSELTNERKNLFHLKVQLFDYMFGHRDITFNSQPKINQSFYKHFRSHWYKNYPGISRTYDYVINQHVNVSMLKEFENDYLKLYSDEKIIELIKNFILNLNNLIFKAYESESEYKIPSKQESLNVLNDFFLGYQNNNVEDSLDINTFIKIFNLEFDIGWGEIAFDDVICNIKSNVLVNK